MLAPLAILIFSKEKDPGTNKVCAWLRARGAEFLRINIDCETPDIDAFELTNDDFRFRYRERWYGLGELTAVWFQKGGLWLVSDAEAVTIPGHMALSNVLSSKIIAETRVAKEYCYHLIEASGVRMLGNPRNATPNKLIVLNLAASVGLAVPDTLVSNQAPEIIASEPGGYITKSMSDGVFLWDYEIGHQGYFTYTEQLSDALRVQPEGPVRCPSLIQRKIDKDFEVRSFFIDGRFFSSAIISQNDEKTKVDYRKYNFEKQNRNVPIELPAEVSDKLRRLFASLSLNTGSVDLIVGEDGEFYFLEINPSGQWGRMSEVCNYKIDAVIADWLMGGEG